MSLNNKIIYDKDNLYWIIIGIISIGIGFSLELIYVSHDINKIPLVFSSISTGLAAIFALVFAIITISVQMTKRYSAMDLFFTLSTVILMLIFSVTIILPLLMIQIGFYFPKIIISLFTFCILSLIPFLKNISSKLKFEVGLQNLKEEICEAIDLNHDASAANKIKELSSLGIASLKENKIDRLKTVIQSLDDIISITVQEMEDIDIFNETHPITSKSFELKKTYDAIGLELINLIYSSSEKRDRDILKDMLQVYGSYVVHHDSSYGITIQQKLLKNLGIKFIKYKFNDEFIEEIEKFLFDIIESNIEGFGLFRQYSIQYIRELAEESFKENLRIPFKKAVLYLWYSGAYAQQQSIEIFQENPISEASHNKTKYISNNLEFVAGQLYKIEELVGKSEFEKSFEEIYNYDKFPGLLEALTKYKSMYDVAHS